MKNLIIREGHFQITVEEQPGSNCWRATPKHKAAHCGSEAGNDLRDEELTPFGKDMHRELGQPTNDSSGRRCNKRVEIRALEGLNVVPVCHEKGSHIHKGAQSHVWGWIVVEILGIGRPRKGRYLQDQQPNRMEGSWRGGHTRGEGRGQQIIRERWRILQHHRENFWRRQSTWGKAEGKVDNDCQNDPADNAGQGAPKVDCNHC
jgi:hypothetical protein